MLAHISLSHNMTVQNLRKGKLGIKREGNYKYVVRYINQLTSIVIVNRIYFQLNPQTNE